MPKVYVSTGGMPELKASRSVARLLAVGISHVELSGGQFEHGGLSALAGLSQRVCFKVHNYFPPPREPFVLNLASADPVIARRSMDHVQEAVRWAVALGDVVYGVHAGFRLDPQPEDLGRRFTRVPMAARTDALHRFIDRIVELSAVLAPKGVELLIENNVLSAENLSAFGEDPFLMTKPDECAWVMEHMPDNVGLLVDVGHAKVSARSLGFEAADLINECREWIRAYHLSENDGNTDANHPITSDSWFWPHIDPDIEYYTLEIYGLRDAHLAKQVSLTQEILGQLKSDRGGSGPETE